MQDIVDQTRAASAQGLYYVALFTALTLPDICGALEAGNGIATCQRYIDWFDRNVAPRYSSFLDGDACYRFRCSLLHQGTTQHPKSKYSRILFLEPGSSGMILHNNVLNDALNINVRIFCEDICSAVETWLQTIQHSSEFEANMPKFVRRYPGGLAPYIVGVPVIG